MIRECLKNILILMARLETETESKVTIRLEQVPSLTNDNKKQLTFMLTWPSIGYHTSLELREDHLRDSDQIDKVIDEFIELANRQRDRQLRK